MPTDSSPGMSVEHHVAAGHKDPRQRTGDRDVVEPRGRGGRMPGPSSGSEARQRSTRREAEAPSQSGPCIADVQNLHQGDNHSSEPVVVIPVRRWFPPCSVLVVACVSMGIATFFLSNRRSRNYIADVVRDR